MNYQKLASAIAKKEGKKSQAKIGEIREILKVLLQLEIEAEDPSESPLNFLLEKASQLAAKKRKAGK